MRGFGELLVERHAGARRAGEQQAVDARLAGERAALVGAADQQPDDAFGDARLVEAADQELAGRRGLLGRLEDDRIAGDQRRDDVAVGQMRREIIGAEHRKHAVRLVAHRDLVAERGLHLPLRRPLGIGLDRNLDLVDDRADLGARFPQRLAGFPRDQLGEFGLFLAHDIGEAAHRLDPIGVRMRGPRRPGGARGGDFGRGIADARPTRSARPSPDRCETSVAAHGARSTDVALSSTCRCILLHRFAHSPDRLNLVVERLPVVALGDRRPDRLDLVDVHRAGRRRPTNRHASAVGSRPSSSCASSRNSSRRIKLGARIAAAAPVEEDAVDRLRSGRQRVDQRRGDARSSVAGGDAEASEHRLDQRLFEAVAPAGEQVGQRRARR